jgi:catechol 2,3-dioxygenase-like lactoylglutathione lyase family enzyme
MKAPLLATLPAADVARAKDWYRAHLGLEPAQEMGDGSAIYETGGVQFMLYASQFAGTNQATAAGFMVDDFDAAIDELRASGVTFEDYDFGDGMRTVDGIMTDPDEGLRAAWFKDSEGNILSVASM